MANMNNSTWTQRPCDPEVCMIMYDVTHALQTTFKGMEKMLGGLIH